MPFVKATNSGYYYIGACEIYEVAIHYGTAPQITYADFAKDYRRCNIGQGDMVSVEFLRYCYMANPSMYMEESALAQSNSLLSKINVTVIYLPPLEL